MSDSQQRVAVTGAAGYIGSRLIDCLEGHSQVAHILAVDIRPPAGRWGSKVVFVQQDISTPLGQSFSVHEIDTLVHLAYVLRPGRDREAIRRVDVGGTVNVLNGCKDAGVSKVVYLSSTSVYGAHADNPPMLTESSPPRPVKGFQYSEDKVEVESLIQRFSAQGPHATATILRCCPVMGPNADNFISRAFLKPFLVAVKGYDPPMQFVHEDDVIDLLVQCVVDDAPGLYNVAGQGVIRWSEMSRMLGRKLVALPAPLLSAATEAAWALRIQSDSPSNGLNFIRYRWTVSTERIRRELGFSARYSSREAWESFVRHH